MKKALPKTALKKNYTESIELQESLPFCGSGFIVTKALGLNLTARPLV